MNFGSRKNSAPSQPRIVSRITISTPKATRKKRFEKICSKSRTKKKSRILDESFNSVKNKNHFSSLETQNKSSEFQFCDSLLTSNSKSKRLSLKNSNLRKNSHHSSREIKKRLNVQNNESTKIYYRRNQQVQRSINRSHSNLGFESQNSTYHRKYFPQKILKPRNQIQTSNKNIENLNIYYRRKSPSPSTTRTERYISYYNNNRIKSKNDNSRVRTCNHHHHYHKHFHCNNSKQYEPSKIVYKTQGLDYYQSREFSSNNEVVSRNSSRMSDRRESYSKIVTKAVKTFRNKPVERLIKVDYHTVSFNAKKKNMKEAQKIENFCEKMEKMKKSQKKNLKGNFEVRNTPNMKDNFSLVFLEHVSSWTPVEYEEKSKIFSHEQESPGIEEEVIDHPNPILKKFSQDLFKKINLPKRKNSSVYLENFTKNRKFKEDFSNKNLNKKYFSINKNLNSPNHGRMESKDNEDMSPIKNSKEIEMKVIPVEKTLKVSRECSPIIYRTLDQSTSRGKFSFQKMKGKSLTEILKANCQK